MEQLREQWVDTAKGIAIILVVFLHATFDIGGAVPMWRWEDATGILDTFRMPLFFFCAGLFATKALRKPFLNLLNDRVSRLAWLYLLWSPIGVLLLPFGDAPVWRGLLAIPVLPYPGTWFIYAIALYFVAMWFLQRLPVPLQIAIAVALAFCVHSGFVYPRTDELVKIAQYFIFYLLAVVGGAAIRSRAPRLGGTAVLAVALAYSAGVGVAGLLGIADQTLVWLSLGLLAVATGCGVAVVLSRVRAFDWVARLGARTLPVYLLHWYLLLVGQWAIVQLGPMPTAVAPFIVPGLVAFAIAGSLSVNRLTARIPGLYDRPRWLIELGNAVVRRRMVRGEPRSAVT